MNDTLLTEPMLDDYTADTVPGWTYQNEGHHIVVNSRFGQLEVGMVPGQSYDQWLFHENRGGGSLVIGWCLELEYPSMEDTPGMHIMDLDGWLINNARRVLKVMMLKSNRFHLKGDQDDWELPGGFVEDGETKLSTGIREMFEETEQLAHPEPVQGRGYTGNRAFFQLNGEDEGTSVFAFRLSSEQIEAINESDKLQLMPWQDAIRITRDALSGMAIGRFVAEQLD